MPFNRSLFRVEIAPRPVLGEFQRFFLAGGLAFLSDFLILFLFTRFLKVNYLISNIFGFSVGLLVSYLLSIKWVFRYRRVKKTWFEFLLFSTFALISLLANELLLWFFVQSLGIYYLESKILTTGVTFLFNFIAKKVFLFSLPHSLRNKSQHAEFKKDCSCSAGIQCRPNPEGNLP